MMIPAAQLIAMVAGERLVNPAEAQCADRWGCIAERYSPEFEPGSVLLL
jgi:hypothetical protein